MATSPAANKVSYQMLPPAPFNQHKQWKICYPRDLMRSLADSPYALLPPQNIRQMVFEMAEMLAKFPRHYQSPTSCFQGWSTRVPATTAITYSRGRNNSGLNASGDARPKTSQ